MLYVLNGTLRSHPSDDSAQELHPPAAHYFSDLSLTGCRCIGRPCPFAAIKRWWIGIWILLLLSTACQQKTRHPLPKDYTAPYQEQLQEYIDSLGSTLQVDTIFSEFSFDKYDEGKVIYRYRLHLVNQNYRDVHSDRFDELERPIIARLRKIVLGVKYVDHIHVAFHAQGLCMRDHMYSSSDQFQNFFNP